jgi:hypothetical protein
MRIAEVALLDGAPAAALAILDRIGGITEDLGEALELETSRYRAIARAATDPDAGLAELIELARRARAVHPDHLAACVDAAADVAARRGAAIDATLLAERDAIARRLGIVRFPPLRLGVEVSPP